MGIVVSRLELSAFESLPPHSRSCVFWEVDDEPDMVGSEFDKEAWISGLLLDWGTCGQVAINTATGKAVGAAFYGPPRRVPRAGSFPTSPVSSDAVLLTSLRTEPGFEEAATSLLDAVIADVVRRGVRAVEAFGLVRSAHTQDPESSVIETETVRTQSFRMETGMADLGEDISFWTEESIVEIAREILSNPLGGLCTECMIDAEFLKDSGFDLVASHQRFPRFRLELDEGLGWKSEVEGALEKLVVMAAIDLAGRQRVPATVGVSRRLGQ